MVGKASDPDGEPSSSKQSRTRGDSLLRDLPAHRLPRRVRHIASVHVRNLNPAESRTAWSSASSQNRRTNFATDESLEQQLYEVAVGFAPPSHARQHLPPVYVTDTSQPCVNADWPVDPLQLSQPGTSLVGPSNTTGIAGQKGLSLSIWARAAHFASGADSPWFLHWQHDVDLEKVEWIPGGLSSPVMRTLPSNSVIIGLTSSTWAARPTSVDSRSGEGAAPHGAHSSDTEASLDGNIPEKLAAHSERLRRDGVRFYLVPPPPISPLSQRRSSRRGRDSHADEIGSDPETSKRASEGGPGDTDTDDNGGYDSETTYELSAHQQPLRRTDSFQLRPGLHHRTSSSRTVKALRKGRRRRSSSALRVNVDQSRQVDDASLPVTHDDEGVDVDHSRTVKWGFARNKKSFQRQLEKEQEREALERSKHDTRMLISYDYNRLREILEDQQHATDQLWQMQTERERLGQVLGSPGSSTALSRSRSYTQGRIAQLHTLGEEEDSSIRRLRGEIASKRDAISRRRARLELVRRQMQSVMSGVDPEAHSLADLRSTASTLEIQAHNRRVHLLETLSRIYPIELLSASDLLYSICGISLPNSPAVALADSLQNSKNKLDPEEIAAALGLAAQLVLLLSSYLGTSLHYEIATAGSRAVVRDGISVMSGPRSFPLYSKGTEMYRFEYAVFLLNKNIEQLMNTHNIPVLDLRHILPNLNNLILTLSSPIALPGPPAMTSASSHPPKTPQWNDDGRLAHRTVAASPDGTKDGSGRNGTSSGATAYNASYSPLPSKRSYRTTGKGEIVLS